MKIYNQTQQFDKFANYNVHFLKIGKIPKTLWALTKGEGVTG